MLRTRLTGAWLATQGWSDRICAVENCRYQSLFKAAHRQAAIALERNPEWRDPFVEPPRLSSPASPATLPREPSSATGGAMVVLTVGETAARLGMSRGELEALIDRGALDTLPIEFGHVLPTHEVARFSGPALGCAQGFTRPIVAVEVRNVGRLTVTATSWRVATRPGGMALQPAGASIGPSLPHRLEGGETATWAVDMAPVKALVDATSTLLTLPVGAERGWQPLSVSEMAGRSGRKASCGPARRTAPEEERNASTLAP
jgi:hypothetical protein